MYKRILILLLIFLLSGRALAGKKSKPEPVVLPEDFKSDGCSLFPDGNYRECCVEHDKAYYVGGSWKQRLRADDRLFACVAHRRGVQHKLAAPIMWIGVRVGGPGYIPTPFRWGYGKKSQKQNQKK